MNQGREEWLANLIAKCIKYFVISIGVLAIGTLFYVLITDVPRDIEICRRDKNERN